MTSNRKQSPGVSEDVKKPPSAFTGKEQQSSVCTASALLLIYAHYVFSIWAWPQLCSLPAKSASRSQLAALLRLRPNIHRAPVSCGRTAWACFYLQETRGGFRGACTDLQQDSDLYLHLGQLWLIKQTTHSKWNVLMFAGTSAESLSKMSWARAVFMPYIIGLITTGHCCTTQLRKWKDDNFKLQQRQK